MKTQYKTSNAYDKMFRVAVSLIIIDLFFLTEPLAPFSLPPFLTNVESKRTQMTRNHFISNDVGIPGRKEIQCLYSFIIVSLRFYYISMVLSCVGMKNAKSIENIICE